MKKLHSNILFLIASLSFLFSINVSAKTVECAIGEYKAPFIFGKGEKGIDVDIVKKSLELKGHKVKFVSMPTNRLQSRVPLKKFECSVGVRIPRNFEKRVYYSDHFTCYENYIISKSSSKISKIKEVSNLENVSLVAWQDAKNDLGSEFYAKFKNAPSKKYKEIASQLNQHKMFLHDRVDAIIADKTIFRYYMNKLSKDFRDGMLKVDFHRTNFIAPSNCDHVAFSDYKLRDDFNNGLRRLRETGEYSKIIDKNVKGVK